MLLTMVCFWPSTNFSSVDFIILVQRFDLHTHQSFIKRSHCYFCSSADVLHSRTRLVFPQTHLLICFLMLINWFQRKILRIQSSIILEMTGIYNMVCTCARQYLFMKLTNSVIQLIEYYENLHNSLMCIKMRHFCVNKP